MLVDKFKINAEDIINEVLEGKFNGMDKVLKKDITLGSLKEYIYKLAKEKWGVESSECRSLRHRLKTLESRIHDKNNSKSDKIKELKNKISSFKYRISRLEAEILEIKEG